MVWSEFTLHARPQANLTPIQVPLFQVGAGQYAAEIAQVHEPMSVWVSGAGTRTTYFNSYRFSARIRAPDIVIGAPQYTPLEEAAAHQSRARISKS